jgi:hypothetical protein
MLTSSRSIAALAARRLAAQRQPVVDARIAEATQAMRAAMVRLDWREAGRQAQIRWELLGRPRHPSGKEREKALERIRRLIEEALARAVANESTNVPSAG